MSTAERISLAVTVFSLAVLLGCGDSRGRDVDHSVNFAKRVLEKTKTDLLANASFASIADQGGSVITYITANIGDPTGFAPYVWMDPPAPYTVVIRPGSAPDEYVIEGYAADTNKPFRTETVAEVGRRRE